MDTTREEDVDQLETALAGVVSKDMFKFDSFLVYILAFFFGFLFAIGLSFFMVGSILVYESRSYTNVALLLAGLGLGGVALVGGFGVWQRLWILLLKVAIACIVAFVYLYVLLVLAYIISHDIASPMEDYADGNWREGAKIATIDLEPDYCMRTIPTECGAPLTSLDGQPIIVPGDNCDNQCKAAWVKEADEAVTPIGAALYVLCVILIGTVVVNNQVIEDDGFDKRLEHYIAYGCNGGLFLFGLITMILTLVFADTNSNFTLWLLLFGLIILGSSGVAAGCVFKDFDWGIRISNVVMLVSFIVILGLAILTSVYGSALGAVTSFYDDNWDDIKQEIRDKDPFLCVDLTDAECKSRFKSKSSKQVQFVAYGCAGVEAFLLVLLWLSLRAVRFWRKVPETNDVNLGSEAEGTDDLGNRGFENPLNDGEGADEDADDDSEEESTSVAARVNTIEQSADDDDDDNDNDAEEDDGKKAKGKKKKGKGKKK